jgi:hypothetical protein
VLWRSLERAIPDIRRRAEVVQIGARRAARGAGDARMRRLSSGVPGLGMSSLRAARWGTPRQRGRRDARPGARAQGRR